MCLKLRPYFFCTLLNVLALFTSATEATNPNFREVATYPMWQSLPADSDTNRKTVAEIMSASPDGTMLYITDSTNNALVFLDISDASMPKAAGRVALTGEPTSVTTSGSHVLTAIDTSRSFADPSGHIIVIDPTNREVLQRCDVLGQPDSIAVSPDRRFVLVAVENERDSDHKSGSLPQLPGGHAVIFSLNSKGMIENCYNATKVSLSGLADVAPNDPEPEYVAINHSNIGVITLQENNHLVLIDLEKAQVLRHFSAGSVDLTNVPVSKSKRGNLSNLKREPDAVTWLDENRFATANEGDYKGGSRGYSIWHRNGSLLFDSGEDLEKLALEHDIYPFKRAKKRGVEPEGITSATFGEHKLIFINAERANFVAVYKDTGQVPEFLQLLRSPPKPEGLLALPERGLLLVSSEDDRANKGIRSAIRIYSVVK